MSKIFPAPGELEDDRTLEEQLDGVKFEQKCALDISGVKWVNKRCGPRKLPPTLISLTKTSLTFGESIAKAIGKRRVLLGVGSCQGGKVILIKPGNQGNTITFSNGGYKISSAVAIKKLQDEGASIGRYEAIKKKDKDKDLFIAIPLKGGGDSAV